MLVRDANKNTLGDANDAINMKDNSLLSLDFPHALRTRFPPLK
jgi:hypothetical protein